MTSSNFSDFFTTMSLFPPSSDWSSLHADPSSRAYLRAVGVGGRGEGPEEVDAEHGDDLGVDRLGQHVPVRRHVLNHLVQGGALHLFPLEIGERIGYEIEENLKKPQLIIDSHEFMRVVLSTRIWGVPPAGRPLL